MTDDRGSEPSEATASTDRIPDAEWRTVVDSVPIVSVDLCVLVDDGLLLGRRTNEPASGEWFVPGGTVFKNERRIDAVHRIARAELGVDVTILDELGCFEHFYDTSDVEGVESKHYLATGYVVRPDTDGFTPDDQHDALRVARPPLSDPHPYVERYLDAMRAAGYLFEE